MPATFDALDTTLFLHRDKTLGTFGAEFEPLHGLSVASIAKAPSKIAVLAFYRFDKAAIDRGKKAGTKLGYEEMEFLRAFDRYYILIDLNSSETIKMLALYFSPGKREINWIFSLSDAGE